MTTIARIAQSYGLKPGDLSRFVGINGVDLQSELNDGQVALIIGLIETSDASGGAGRHNF